MFHKNPLEFFTHSYDYHNHGVIEASAGSGKTTAIVELVAKLLEERICQPEEILVITFTNNATQELKTRIYNYLAKKKDIPTFSELMNNRITIKSIHSFLYSMSRVDSSILDQEGVSFLFLVRAALKQIVFGYINGVNLENKPFTKETLHHFLYYSDPYYSLWDEEKMFQQGHYRKKDEAYLAEIMKSYDYIYFNDQGLLESQVYPALLSKEEVETLSLEVKSLVKEMVELTSKKEWEILNKEKDSVKEWSEYLLTPINHIVKSYHCNLVSLIGSCISFSQQVKSPTNYKKLEKKLKGLGAPTKGVDKESLLNFLDDMSKLIDTLFKLIEPFPYQVHAALLKDLPTMLYGNRFALDVKTQEQALRYINQYQNEFMENKGTNYRYVFIDEAQDTSQLEWESIKSIFAYSDAKICLIGDPKQSIYQFKGGNVYAYFKAYEDLVIKGAKEYTLKTNYRSHPLLVSIFNKLFSHPQFFSSDSKNHFIQYQNMDAGLKESAFYDVKELKKHCTILDGASLKIDSEEWGKKISQEYIYWIKSIKLLDKTADIAILARSAKDLNTMYLQLKKAGIRAYQYKKRDLFNSKMADDILILLFSLTKDSNEADLYILFQTPFFVGLENQKVKEDLFKELNELIEKNYWYDFAHSCLYKLSLHSFVSKEDFDIYKQILNTLCAHAQNRVLKVEHLIERLLNLKEKENDFHEDNYYDFTHNNEETQPVLLMTIHASKGLQFDYVFTFLSHEKSSFKEGFSVLQNHFQTNKIYFRVPPYSLVKEDIDLNRYQEQSNIAYVALTRAKKAIFITSMKSSKTQDHISFLSFFDSLIKDDTVSNYNPIENPKGKELYENIKHLGNPKKEIEKIAPPRFMNYLSTYGKLITEEHIFQQYSFSSLKIQLEEDPLLIFPLLGEERSEKPFNFIENIYDLLPKGKEIGTIFHYLLENLTLDLKKDVSNNTIKQYVFNILKRTIYQSDEINDLFVQLLGDVLALKLPHQNLTIREILRNPLCYKNEVVINNKTSHLSIGLKAIVDMIWVDENDRVYFLDWKTNYLTHYDNDSLKKIIDKHYDYQWKIYLVSLVQYLSQQLKGFDYDKNIGGIYYCFVRGVKFSSAGTYYIKAPSFKEYQKIVQEVDALLKQNIEEKQRFYNE